MVINIDKGTKVKVKSIDFEGNSELTDAKLKKAFKNTKQKNVLRIFKSSKFIKEKYKEDLDNVVTKYKEKGHRDARIIYDSVSYNKKNNTIEKTKSSAAKK